MRNIILSILFLTFFSSGLVANDKIYTKEYLLRGKTIRLEVETGFSGSDVFLNSKTRKNLSYNTPGENLFPRMFIKKNVYSVTWINYRKNDVRLNFYDSLSDIGKNLVSGKFEFISSDTCVLFDMGKPKAVLFRAIKGADNEDIFIHDISSGRTKRITSTPGDENRIIVEDTELNGRNYFKLRTQTLNYDYLYSIDINDLSFIIEEKRKIIRGPKLDKTEFTTEELNTIIGFGDSVTWGKMRMYEFTDSYHPELTYWAKASEHFNENYGQTHTINLGVNRDSSLNGVERMDEDLLYDKGYFLLVLFGTNDVTSGAFSSTSTSRNIQWILENGRNKYGMYPVVSTVPPQKLYLEGVQFYKDHTEELNDKIKQMATVNSFPYIDSYTAFFNQDEDWEKMLEDIKGNHPSPKGHQVMADMVIPILLKLIPEIPLNVSFSPNTGGNSFDVNCNANIEFDFDHYNLEFGFSPTKLDREMTYPSNSFTVYFYPFNLNLKRTVYFKLQSVDKDGNASEFTDIYSVYLN